MSWLDSAKGLFGGDSNDFTSKYNTPLPDSQRAAYEEWAKTHGKGGRYDYDLQGAFLDHEVRAQIEKGGHGSDRYKKPNHPTFSNESVYSGKDGNYGGVWTPAGDFIATQQNVRNAGGPRGLQQYFDRVEPDVKLRLPMAQDRPEGEPYRAVTEPAAELLTRVLAAPVAGLAGLGDLAAGRGASRAADTVRRTQESLTYEPRTTRGRAGSAAADAVLGPVDRALSAPGRAVGNAGLPLAGAALTAGAALIGRRGARVAPSGIKTMDELMGKIRPYYDKPESLTMDDVKLLRGHIEELEKATGRSNASVLAEIQAKIKEEQPYFDREGGRPNY